MQTRRYAEGTGIRLEVTGPTDIDTVLKLTAIKLDHENRYREGTTSVVPDVLVLLPGL
jgi:hypothetical protein